MPQIEANGLTLHYEVSGAADAPPVLLIMGLGGQLISWPQAFCDVLLAAGYCVIRFDNRDIGLSTRLKALGKPDLLRAGIASTLRLPVRAPYRLDDMATDTWALLDALDIESAHLVGVSMGGMIAQLMAIGRPQRVRSLSLLMTHSGNPRLPGARWPIRLRMVRRPHLRVREDIIRYSTQTLRLIGSPGYPFEADALWTQVAAQYDRSHHPAGVIRQTAAILAAPSRSKALKRLRLPTLILHGREDPLIPVAAARELKQLMPHARLEIIDGMGHDLPPGLAERLGRSVAAGLDAA
ncbi:MAG: alpha/beta fold hydrolase [Solimonas sp.]